MLLLSKFIVSNPSVHTQFFTNSRVIENKKKNAQESEEEKVKQYNGDNKKERKKKQQHTQPEPMN
jgi:hypothetical protein